MKKTLSTIFLLFIIGGAALYYYKLNSTKPKPVHFHAGFQIYVDGKIQDFSSLKYMNVEPCTAHPEETTDPEHEQEEKAHLHDLVGDVVHVHRANSTWGDLFKNMQFNITSSKPITSYINGQKVNHILTLPIKSYDILVLIIGEKPKDTNFLKKAVTKNHIIKTEKKSETCGTN